MEACAEGYVIECAREVRIRVSHLRVGPAIFGGADMRNEKERREAALWRVMRYFGFFTDRSVKRGGSEFTRGA